MFSNNTFLPSQTIKVNEKFLYETMLSAFWNAYEDIDYFWVERNPKLLDETTLKLKTETGKLGDGKWW